MSLQSGYVDKTAADQYSGYVADNKFLNIVVILLIFIVIVMLVVNVYGTDIDSRIDARIDKYNQSRIKEDATMQDIEERLKKLQTV